MKKIDSNIVEEVIISEITDLDRKIADYQETYNYYYGKDDEQANHIHKLLISLCYKIRTKIIG